MVKHIPYSCALRDDNLIEAVCMSIDEGDVSPDVVGFDEESFIRELKSTWQAKSIVERK